MSSPTLTIDYLFILGIWVGKKWHPVTILNCIYLMTNNAECFFMYLLIIVSLLWRNSYSNPLPTKNIDFIFWSSFSFIAQLSGKYKDFQYSPPPAPRLPYYQYRPPEHYIRYNRWTLTYHGHPKSIVCITVHSMGLDKCKWHVSTTIISYRVSLP